jgi:hypothetical protein
LQLVKSWIRVQSRNLNVIQFNFEMMESLKKIINKKTCKKKGITKKNELKILQDKTQRG